MRRFFSRSFLATVCLGGCLAASTIQCEIPDIQIITGGGHGYDYDDFDDDYYIYEDGGCCCCDDGFFDWWW